METGVTVRDLRRPRNVPEHDVCGAIVLLGSPGGKPSPATSVPDLVCVVYGHSRPGSAGPPNQRSQFGLGRWTPSWPNDEHAAAISAVRAAIGRGDVYQANVVGHASAPYTGDPG